MGLALLALALYIWATTLHPGLLDDRSGPSDSYLTREPDDEEDDNETGALLLLAVIATIINTRCGAEREG